MAEQSEDIVQRLRGRAEVWRRYFPLQPTVEVSVARIQFAATECDEAADEIERLRAELRRFQRIVIDASEVGADCEDLCGVLCAGPCQGIDADALSGS